MKIIELRAENYKRIKAVTITPTGNLVTVQGRNAQGKSSVLDAIYAALAGASAIPSKPIRKGTDRAVIALKLGDEKVDLIVTRTFDRGEGDKETTKLTVETPDGARPRSPQTLLDGMLDALSFDPLQFKALKPKEQLTELRAFVPDVDFDALDEQNRGDFQRRTDVSRQARLARAELTALTVPGDPRVVRIDESALVTQLEQAGEQNAEIERRRSRRLEAQRSADAAKGAADRARALAAELRRQAADLMQRAGVADEAAVQHEQEALTLTAKLDAAEPLPSPVETTSLRKAIADAGQTNRAVDERDRVLARRAELEQRALALEAQAEDYTAAMAAREKTKADAVAAAKLPIDGLSFGADEVLLHGFPFEQASDAEQLRASVAIAAAKNAALKVIRIRDGSLLDDEGVALLAQFAADHGLQVWLEKVASDAKTGIVIEDGALKATDSAEVAA